jgi:hypothetical protein
MFVGTPVCRRHRQTILPQGRGLKFPLTDRFFVLEIAASCFRRRSAAIGNTNNLERVRQSFSNQINTVAALDATARRRSLTVDLHMPSNHRSRRETASLEKPAIEQPSIDA